MMRLLSALKYITASLLMIAGVVAFAAGTPESVSSVSYPTHAALIAATPWFSFNTINQTGFYANGDGGAATYQWNATSYCSTGTSAAPGLADGIVCILPSNQSASSAGRYLLSASGSIDVRQVGMRPGGFDNSPLVPVLMATQNAGVSTSPGSEIVFPSVLGQINTDYYFSQPFVITKGSTIRCRGATNTVVGPVYLVFPPGVDGLIQETGFLSPDASYGSGDITGCSITSLGGGITATTVAIGVGGNSVTDVYLNLNTSPSELTMPASCNPYVSSTINECTVGVGDGIVIYSEYKPLNSAPEVAPGAYVGTSNPGARSFTLASPYVILPNLTPASVILWDLPAAQKYTVQTTVGSDTFTVTAGPRILKVGDLLWSDAFVFGTTVWNVQNNIVGTPTVNTGGSGYTGSSGTMTWSGPGCSGAWNHPPVLNVTASGGVITGVTGVADTGECLQTTPASGATTWTAGGGLSGGSGASFNMAWNQTVQVRNAPVNASAPATMTHTSGSPGQMWTIPAGIVRRTEAKAHDNIVTYFGIGLNMTCASGGGPATGCNFSFDEHNSFSNSLMGHLVRGDNSAVSTFIGNIFANNSIADDAELGQLGSTYISEGYNSEEDATSIYDFIGFCGAQNYSIMMGEYSTGAGNSSYCIGTDTQGNGNIGTPVDLAQGSMLFLNGVNGSPFPSIGPLAFFNGAWQFRGPTSLTLPTTVPTASGNTVAIATYPVLFAGMAVTDLTHAVIPANTTVTVVGGSSIGLSNALTGAVQIGDKLQFSYIGGSTMCFEMTPGLVVGIPPGMNWSHSCDSGMVSMSFDGYVNSWELNSNNSSIRLPDTIYLGYLPGGSSRVVFPNGFTIGTNSYAGSERYYDIGATMPAEAWHLWGDTRFYNNPTPGLYDGWVNTQLSAVSLTASIAAGATSVPVSSCPVLPAGTPIIAEQNFSVSGIVLLDKPLGTLATCVGTTLTLQAGAANAALNGSAIQFMGYRAMSPVANDAAGTSWTLGNFETLTPVAIGSLPSCSGTSGMRANVNNGLPSPTYHQAVSAIGSPPTVQPVACAGGTGWIYD